MARRDICSVGAKSELESEIVPCRHNRVQAGRFYEPPGALAELKVGSIRTAQNIVSPRKFHDNFVNPSARSELEDAQDGRSGPNKRLKTPEGTDDEDYFSYK